MYKPVLMDFLPTWDDRLPSISVLPCVPVAIAPATVCTDTDKLVEGRTMHIDNWHCSGVKLGSHKHMQGVQPCCQRYHRLQNSAPGQCTEEPPE